MMKKPPHQVSLRLVIIIAAIVFVVVAAAAVFFATQFFAQQPDDEAQRVVAKVEKLYMLPQSELKVVKIQDKDKLGGQAFYKQAQNGDYVLMYPQAKLALLYRESVDKLVNVAANAGAVEMP